MNKEVLGKIISNGENSTTEFKATFNTKVIESIVAFSNAYGGNILIGVNDSAEIVGIDINSETIQQWQNEIKQKTEPSIIPSLEVIEIKGKHLVVIIVPEFPIKPVSTKGRYFIRKNNSNHRLSTDEIVEMRFVSLSYSFDSYSVSTKFEDLDKKALQFFIEKVEKTGRFILSSNLQNDFEKLGLIKEDKLTRACELLFGLHHTNIHIGRFKSEITIIDDLMIRSPLVYAIKETLNFIKKNIRLGFEFGGDGLQRTEKWQFPIPALR